MIPFSIRGLPGPFLGWMAVVAAVAALATLWGITGKGISLVAFIELFLETQWWAVGGAALAAAAAFRDARLRKRTALLETLRLMSDAIMRVLAAWLALTAVAATIIGYL